MAECVSSRHLRRSNHSTFAYQSSGPGMGAGSATGTPMTVRSFFVHRKITGRSYAGLDPAAPNPSRPRHPPAARPLSELVDEETHDAAAERNEAAFRR